MQNNMVIEFFHNLKILHFLGIKSEIYSGARLDWRNEIIFRRIVDGGIKKPVALASNHAQREIFVFDQVSAKVTFLSDSGRFITQISTKLKTDLTGMVHFEFSNTLVRQIFTYF